MKTTRKNPTTTRVCTRCKRRKKKATDFYTFYGGKDNLMSHCKICVRERSTIWTKKNRKRASANCRRWMKKNPKKVAGIRARAKAQRKANPEQHRASVARWRARRKAEALAAEKKAGK
jgi:hypothetical protein